jgi:hypothetical protein
MALFIIKLVRAVMKFKSSQRPSVDDLRERAENLKRKMKDIEEADFREIPPDEDKDSKIS